MDLTTWYADGDGDGFGDYGRAVTAREAPEGYAPDYGDCDEADVAVNPGADEVCDGMDNNCDGAVDEQRAVDAVTWYSDSDGDGYGDPEWTATACEAPEGYVPDGGDCDDRDALVSPGAEEFCDDVDNDCDGVVDWGLRVPGDFLTIQEAVDASGPGDSVCVGAGTCVGTVDLGDREVALRGTWGASSTTLEGGGMGPVVRISGSGASPVALSGFTITGGGALLGAGVFIDNATVALSDLVITRNEHIGSADTCAGGGLYALNSTVVLEGVDVIENYLNCMHVDGVGACFGRSDAGLRDVTVHLNRSSVGKTCNGAGVMMDNGASADLQQVSVIGNNCAGTEEVTGAVHVYDHSVASLRNVIIASNYGSGATMSGAGMTVSDSASATMTNVVLCRNGASAGTCSRGSGITLLRHARVSIDNTVVEGNVDAGSGSRDGGGLVADSTSSFSATWSNVFESLPTNFNGVANTTGYYGNLSKDPMFADLSSVYAVEWDFSLRPRSLLIDAGNPSILDPDGTVSDIGAYGGPYGSW